MKTFALTFFILCSGCIFVESVNLNCAFENDIWSILRNVKSCSAYDQGEIITNYSNRQVSTINGSTSTNPSVKFVDIQKSNCFYFPLGLQKLFTDLQAMRIDSSKLREIRREDLKEYTNLKFISLFDNEIKFLEPNLFDFNPKLEGIFLHSNKIASIDANVFNNFVDKLRILYLSENICQFENVWDDKSKANQIIEKVQRGSCNNATAQPSISSAEFEALKKLIVDLTIKIETQNSEIKETLKALKDEQTEIKKKLWLW